MANDIRAKVILESRKAQTEAEKLGTNIEKTLTNIHSITETVTKSIATLTIKAKQISAITKYTDALTVSNRLLSSSFNSTRKEATAFIDRMQRMTGLDENSLTKATALFGKLGQSLSLTEEYSEKLSEGLTTLTAKLSLLYNKDFNQMADNVRRAVQGTQETLKATTGIEANEVNEAFLLADNGINRTVSSLNDAEQSIVRYATITENLTKDMNVYADAVNSVAWQKMMLTSQINRVATAFGQALYPVLERILPVLNALLMVIEELFHAMAKLFGYSGGIASATSTAVTGYNNVGKSIAGATKQAQRSLRSFDKLNNITTPQDTSSSGSSGSGVGVDPAILGLLDKANDNFLDIENKATQIKDRIMEWLGFMKQIDPVTGEVSYKLRDGLTNIEKIKLAIEGIIALGILKKVFDIVGAFIPMTGVSSGLAKTIATIFKHLKNIFSVMGMSGILGTVTTIATMLAGILLIVAGIVTVFEGIQDILSGDVWSGTFEVISGIALAVARSCIIIWCLAGSLGCWNSCSSWINCNSNN